MNSRSVSRRHIQRALRHGDIVPWYQPVVDIKGQMTGVEVLARWICHDGTRISPDAFIPVAMSSGLIASLTEVLMTHVSRELPPLIRWLPQPFKVGFNMPASCLDGGDIPTCCREFLSSFPAGSVRLTVEITERDSALALYRVSSTLTALISSGVDIALDDFGTGCANLNLLCQLPLTTVKLDRMFCTGAPGSAEALTAASITQLARRLGIHVLAEGVETLSQVKRMIGMGADTFQGFYFSQPVPLNRLMWRALPGALMLQERTLP